MKIIMSSLIIRVSRIITMFGLGETAALGSLGAVVNNRTVKPNIKNQNNKSKKEKSNCRDIYSANNSRIVRDDYETKARARYRASRNFKKTKIIPKNYKELEEYQIHQARNKVAKIEAFSDAD